MYKNGIDLLGSLKDFLDNCNNYSIIVPYIKKSKLLELLETKGTCTQIVVRWEPRDLIHKSSDLGVFEICKTKGITLYRNPRIHLKAFLDSSQNCFMGSANISERALSRPTSTNYNYEIGTIVENIDIESATYMQNIILESKLVTEEYVNHLKRQLEQIPDPMKPPEDFEPMLDTDPEETDFLLSALPMTPSVDYLINIYLKSGQYNAEELNCAAHDLALYQVPVGLEKDEVYAHIKNNFNNHPFIKELKEHIRKQEGQSLRYGGVVDWIKEKTTTVPTPRSWELKQEQIVNILYEWICFFDKDFVVEVPGRKSEVIFYRPIS